jgi:hypothetical protein
MDLEPERNVGTAISGIGPGLKPQFPAHFNTRAWQGSAVRLVNKAYLAIRRWVGFTSVGAAGEIAAVSQGFQPDGRRYALTLDWHKLHITSLKSWITLSRVKLEIRGCALPGSLASRRPSVICIGFRSVSLFAAQQGEQPCRSLR